MVLECDVNCTLLLKCHESQTPPTSKYFITQLSNNNDDIKIKAMEELIIWMSNGETYVNLLITVIQYIMPTSNHRLKKIFFIYWEIVEKTRAGGNLSEEIILVVNMLLKDLNHPNEYIRGSTLRLLSKMKYIKIIEPLLNSIISNINHSQAYVRRNAIMCSFALVKRFGLEIMPTVIDIVENCLYLDEDISCTRNCFLMLLNFDITKALNYLINNQNQITKASDILQIAFLDLIKQFCIIYPSYKSLMIKLIINLLENCSSPVAFDAAETLVYLSKDSLSVKKACQAYITILMTQSDNNIKLIVLKRLEDIILKHIFILNYITEDLIRVLTTISVEVKKKILNLLKEGASIRNADIILNSLKKELSKINEENEDYNKLLLNVFRHVLFLKPDYILKLIDLLSDLILSSSIKLDVSLLIKDFVNKFVDYRKTVVDFILENIHHITDASSLRMLLWILGEYGEPKRVVDTLFEHLLPLPLISQSSENAILEEKNQIKTIVMPDGSYSQTTHRSTIPHNISNLRSLIMADDILLASVISVSIAKLNKVLEKNLNIKSFYIVSSILSLYEKTSDFEALRRIRVCLQYLLEIIYNQKISGELLQYIQVENNYNINCLNDSFMTNTNNNKTKKIKNVDMKLNYGFLNRDKNYSKISSFSALDLTLAIEGITGGLDSEVALEKRLQNIRPLNGLADEIYVEVYPRINQYDLRINYFLINRTKEVLQEIKLELYTQGDLKIVESPAPFALGSGESVNVQASVKMEGSETGLIFGWVSYHRKTAAEKEFLYLEDLQMDLLEYFKKGFISDQEFRSKWSEFEWENKIKINFPVSNPKLFLEYFLRSTKMTIVGKHKNPENFEIAQLRNVEEKEEDTYNFLNSYKIYQSNHPTLSLLFNNNSNFISLNFYSSTIFNDDALANISLQKLEETLIGVVRIRSRSQGIALKLGEKINQIQKMSKTVL